MMEGVVSMGLLAVVLWCTLNVGRAVTLRTNQEWISFQKSQETPTQRQRPSEKNRLEP